MRKIGFLDIHCHILPGVDDGSKDEQMTRQMLQMTYEQGVRTIVATPHYYPGHTQLSGGEIRELVAKVDGMAKEIDEKMSVLPGNEILYDDGVIRGLKQGEILTLADSRYVLVEFLPQENRRRIEEGVRRLLEGGYAPVIAHVERVGELFENEFFARFLRQMGCYMQVNTQTLMGGIFDGDARKAKQWIQKGYVQFLGSDCHNITGRAPLMEDAVRKLRKNVSEETLNRIVYDNPKRFLEKKYI